MPDIFTPGSIDPPFSVSDLDQLFAAYPPVMSVAQVAEVLGRPASTIYKWLGDGTIPAFKIADTWIIYRRDVRQLLDSGHNSRQSS